LGRVRTIGLIGGMSWESTAEYYRLANEVVAERLGGLHSAQLVLTSVDFAGIEELQRAGDWTRAGELLAAEAARLEGAGADLVVLCTNTMHKVAEPIRAALGVPFLDIVDVTADAARSAGAGTVGLLGTAYTMEQDFYRDRLAAHGLRTLVPDAEDRATVHRIIYDELCRGLVREESRAAYRAVMARLVDAGADAIALACTEIELLVGAADASVPVLPTTRLHVEAAVAAALAPPGRG
jgi:aspartate racemase